jgi:hypothetical protein
VPLYERFAQALGDATGRPAERGVFAADMRVALVNDGPVTIWIDSRRKTDAAPDASPGAVPDTTPSPESTTETSP